jgi:hypothetical protein
VERHGRRRNIPNGHEFTVLPSGFSEIPQNPDPYSTCAAFFSYNDLIQTPHPVWSNVSRGTGKLQVRKNLVPCLIDLVFKSAATKKGI